jgi:O-antigen ligase
MRAGPSAGFFILKQQGSLQYYFINFIQIDAVQNTSTLTVTKLFVLGLITASVILSPYVLDFTLTPRYIALSLAVLAALLIIYKRLPVISIRTDLVLVFYFAFVFLCLLSVLWAHTYSEGFFDSFKLLLSFAVFLFSLFCLKMQKEYFTDKILKFSVMMVFIELLSMLYQFTQVDVINKISIYNISGINGHKNLLSSYLFLNSFFLTKAFRGMTGKWKTGAGLAIVLTFIMILFLRTKAVWTGAAVALALFSVLYLYRRTRWTPRIRFSISLVIVAVTANIFFLLIAPQVIGKGLDYNTTLHSTSESNAGKAELDNERLMLWHKSYGMFNDHPLFGVGMGNWQIYFPDQTLKGIWRAEDLNFTFQRPHNDFLWILCETGIVGFNLFLLFVLSVLLLLLRTYRAVPGRPESDEMILCFAFIVGYLTISFFDFPKERMEHSIWINVLFAISYFHIRKNNLLSSRYNFSLNRQNLPAFILLMLIVCAGGLLRYNGERYTRKMYDLRTSKQYERLIAAGCSALSFVYTLDPTSVPIRWYTGNAYVNMGDIKRGHRELKKAYALHPYNRNVLSDLGSSFAVQDAHALAKPLYFEALRISPRFDDPKLNLAALYIAEKDYKSAKVCLDSMYHDSQKRSDYKKIVDAFISN